MKVNRCKSTCTCLRLLNSHAKQPVAFAEQVKTTFVQMVNVIHIVAAANDPVTLQMLNVIHIVAAANDPVT